MTSFPNPHRDPDEYRPTSPLLPSAPIGTFRLFRFLSLYPVPTIELRNFPYAETSTSRSKNDLYLSPGAPSESESSYSGSGRKNYQDSQNASSSSNQCPPYDAISYCWNPNGEADVKYDDVVSTTTPEQAGQREQQLQQQLYTSATSTGSGQRRSDTTVYSDDALGRAPRLTPTPTPTSVSTPEPTQTIIVHTRLSSTSENGPIVIRVTSHLLYGLLTAQELHSPTWLFVDAICIDQADAWDKAVQVQGMSRIFRGAVRVLIWLGMDLSPPSANTAMKATAAAAAAMARQHSGLQTRAKPLHESETAYQGERVNRSQSQYARQQAQQQEQEQEPGRGQAKDQQAQGHALQSETSAGTEMEVDTIEDDVYKLGACLTQIVSLSEHLSTLLSDPAEWIGGSTNTIIREKENPSTGLSMARSSSQSAAPQGTLTQPPVATLVAQQRSMSFLYALPDGLWYALERLRLNPWFSRLWVLQEATLANEALLLYGKYTLPWSQYAGLTALCERCINGGLLRGFETDLINRMYYAYNGRVSAMEKLRIEYHRSRYDEDIYDRVEDDSEETGHHRLDQAWLIRFLIHNIRKTRCALPVDRVYAVLGLLGAHLRESVRIDYTPAAQERPLQSWIEFFQVLLSFVPHIATHIFSTATYLTSCSGLPSWCPNLMEGGDYCGISNTSRIRSCAGMPNGKTWDRYKNLGGYEIDANLCPVRVIRGTHSLRVAGVVIDEVQQVVDLGWLQSSLQWSKLAVDQSQEISSDVARDLLVTLWKCLEKMREFGMQSSDGDAVLSRCLIANSYGKTAQQQESDDEHPDPNAVLEDYTCFMHYLEHHTWGSNASGPLNETTRTNALRFANRFQRLARRRAFFITRSGRSGLCSSRTQNGDVLVLLMNFEMPYLLRGRSGSSDVGGGEGGSVPSMYELICETYVDGIMNGEGFAGRDMEREVPQEFIIC